MIDQALNSNLEYGPYQFATPVMVLQYILLYILYLVFTTQRHQSLYPFLDIMQYFIDSAGSQRAV